MSACNDSNELGVVMLPLTWKRKMYLNIWNI